jgi:hypothetical protein
MLLHGPAIQETFGGRQDGCGARKLDFHVRSRMRHCRA